ncbi:MAG TPA: hypothetical protein VFD27_14050, partial [Chthoniobacteraceae bacterium]|nr:hypothetical protein [Chthoniobacteraceae bacterium]
MSWRQEHIGLVAIGGAGWMGGANYIRHLAAAIDSVSPETKVSILCGKPLAGDWCDVRPRVEVAAKPTFFSREPLRRGLQRAAFDFLYPLTYDNEYNLGLRFPIGEKLAGTHWAGWVPDFQHRHLPELFSEEEFQRRDAQIAALAAEAPRIIFSSKSAAADFATFVPDHAAKAVVLNFATNPIPPSPTNEVDAPPRFLLVCNQFWKHKNHL